MSCGPIAINEPPRTRSSESGTTRGCFSYQVSVPACWSHATRVPSGETASHGHKEEPMHANSRPNGCAVSSGDQGHCSSPQSIGGSIDRSSKVDQLFEVSAGLMVCG